MNNVWNSPIPYVEQAPPKIKGDFLFCDVLTFMYDMSKRKQLTINEMSTQIGIEKYIEEFCTIRVSGARQIGHTEGLVDFTQTTLADLDVLWICKDHGNRSRIYDILRRKYPARTRNTIGLTETQIMNESVSFCSADEIEESTRGKSPFDCIVIDNYSAIISPDNATGKHRFMRELNTLCRYRVHNDPNFFLFLIQ